MKTSRRRVAVVSRGVIRWTFRWTFAALVAATLNVEARAEDPPALDRLERPGADALSGRLGFDPRQGPIFVPEGAANGVPVVLGPRAVVVCGGRGPAANQSAPTFRVELGNGARVSGRAVELDANTIRLEGDAGGATLAASRGGVLAVTQRPGQSIVLREDFETLNPAVWKVEKGARLVETPHLSGKRSLALDATGGSIAHTLAEPVAAGRFEVAFLDGAPGASLACTFQIELEFRGESGPRLIRVLLGFENDALAVETPTGPTLAVQRLPRRPGRRRLVVRFASDAVEIAVDGDELAHGRGPDGPLVAIRAACVAGTKDAPVEAGAPAVVVGVLDDLVLTRFSEPVGGQEIDLTQDEIRGVNGDQLFGKIETADSRRVVALCEGRRVALPWSEVSGLYLRREPRAATAVEGRIARVEWRVAHGDEPRDVDVVEGAVVAIDDNALAIDVPYLGRIAIPRPMLRRVTFDSRARRVVLDAWPHHLGDEISIKPPLLDPPRPEGRRLSIPCRLDSILTGRAVVVLDVVEVAGEAPGLPYSAWLAKGELRTNLVVNGKPIDYINRYVNNANETPARIRIPIPAGVLKPGANTLALEQSGIAGNPDYLDDLGLLGVAIEFETPAP